MRIIILFPCLIISLTALCQIQPKLKATKKNSESNKNSSILYRPLVPNSMAKNKATSSKKSDKKLTASKPTDHLLDLKHEPE